MMEHKRQVHLMHRIVCTIGCGRFRRLDWEGGKRVEARLDGKFVSNTVTTLRALLPGVPGSVGFLATREALARVVEQRGEFILQLPGAGWQFAQAAGVKSKQS